MTIPNFRNDCTTDAVKAMEVRRLYEENDKLIATLAREREANRLHRIALVEDRDAARHEVDYLKGLIRDGKLVYVERGSK